MYFTKLLISAIEFAMYVSVSVLVIFISYKMLVKSNTDFDEEEEIKKGNVAIGILVVAIMVASALMIQKGLQPIFSLFHIFFTTPVQQSISQWQLPIFALAHFCFVFAITIITLSYSLRLFGKLGRKKMAWGKELLKGNVAVGLILSGVVLIVSLYVSDGLGSLAKALIPKQSIGQVRVLK
ncbi:DUF350 domain-containing protein [Elusimicrobiota bacterium]